MSFNGTFAQGHQGLLVDLNSQRFSGADGQNASSHKLRKIIQLKEGRQTLREVLQDIAGQAGLKLSYSEQLIPLTKEIQVKQARVTAEEALWRVLKGTSLRFGISATGQLFFFEVQKDNTVIQLETVTGTVTDASTGETLPGVNVLVKGTSTGTATGVNGAYELGVESLQDTLVFSFIGYQSQEVPINGQTQIDVALQTQAIAGEELVVVGYGTQKRSDITGSVSSVPEERLENLPVTNVTQALEGTTAGLNINTQSSVPGTVAGIQVRGLNSITADNAALVVVDGTPFYGSLADINTRDVESIEVLKDASATAIYGNRGSNGVILVTTKQGREGKPVINYSVSYGMEDFSHVLEPMGPDAYVQKYADYMEQSNQEQTAVLRNTAEIENYNAGITPTDWIDETTQAGVIAEHNVSLSGGTESARYFLSGGYLDQKGVVKGYQYNRVNFRANLDLDVTDWLETGVNAYFANNNYDGGRVNFLHATAMSPYAVPTDENGEYIIYPMSPEQLFVNPMLGLTTDQVDHEQNLSGTAFAVVSPLDNLEYRVNASYYHNPRYRATYTGRAANDNNGTAYKFNSARDRWVVENILSYTQDFDKHHVDATLLYSAEEQNYQDSELTGVGFSSDALSYNQIESADNLTGASAKYKQSWLSQMGRINYNYDSRYLFSFTVRRDGASVFGANTSKYGLFPSVALGWNMANESFMEDISEVSQLKVRFSYGTTGNPAINVYGTQSTAGSVLYPFGGSAQVGTYINGMGNTDLHWESTTTINLGVDFGLFNNRLNGSVEVYDSKTKDLILSRNIPNITGSGSVLDNIGEVGNKGIDLTLNSVNIVSGDFMWETNLVFSTYKNEILALYGNNEDDIANRWFIGKSLGVVYDYKKIGIWQEDEIEAGDHLNHDPTARPGDYKFADINEDGQIDSENDRVILGNTLPKWTGGLTNTFHYKNFSLSIFLQTVQGVLKNNREINYVDEGIRRNTPAEVGYWTPENKSNEWGSLIAYQNDKGYGHPKDASYLRIKDLRLSYDLPKSLLSKYNIQGLTVYFAGRNLYTFTDWIGWNPETDQLPRGASNDDLPRGANEGNNENNYPLVRTLSLGLNISL